VPVVRNGGDDAVDVLAVEEFVIFARHEKIGLGGDFFCELMAAIPKIRSSDALYAGKSDGVGEKRGALHADADDAKTDAVARRNIGAARRNRIGIREKFWSDCSSPGESRGAL